MGTIVLRTVGGESVMIPFEFRWSLVSEGGPFIESDEDAQGGWVFILITIVFYFE